MDFNTRQYTRPGDLELFYYNDIAFRSVDAHEHDYYGSYLFLEGDVEHHVGNKSYQLEYEDCLLIPSGTFHYPRSHSYDKPYRRFIFWLNRGYHKELQQTDEELTYYFDHAQSHQTYRFRTDAITTQETQGKLTDLTEGLAGGCSFHRLASELMTISFLVYADHLLYDSLHQKSAVYENVLHLNIYDYINRHLEKDLSLGSLSSFLYVSKYYVSHIFKGDMDIPLHQYILKKRPRASKNAILSDHPISHVYLQYGFKDYTSFFRVFRKECDVSPRECREQHRLPKQQDYII